MKRAAKVVGVALADEPTRWHLVGGYGPGYATLCGLDGDDPAIGQMGTVEPGPRQRVTCAQCYGIWRHVVSLSVRVDDFGPEATS